MGTHWCYKTLEIAAFFSYVWSNHEATDFPLTMPLEEGSTEVSRIKAALLQEVKPSSLPQSFVHLPRRTRSFS